jgi:hypothetical protein
MRTETDYPSSEANGGESEDKANALVEEKENSGPDSAPPASKKSELLKAMYYFVLSRL